MKISEIAIYPVKSLGAVMLHNSAVGRRGLELDRRFMLVDGEGTFLTQRQNSTLARIKVALTTTHILFSFENSGTLKIPLADLSSIFVVPKTVQVWKSRVEALVAREAINIWFSEILRAELYLVYMPDDSERAIDEAFNKGNEIVSFADAYPLLLANSASLADLNTRLEKPLPMSRFRPNVVVEGAGAFEEDTWRRVRIGSVDFRVTKPSARCVVTTIDQTSGEKHPHEPLKTLSGFRKSSDVFPESYLELGLHGNDVLFGTNLVPETEGERIAVGDELLVID